MGNSCAKGPPADEGAAGGDTPAADKAGFRDRRLSVSQVPNEKSPARRLSVYDDSEDGEPPAQIHESVGTCSVKSVAGMEPVPGGSTRKINQDRALTIYPYLEDKTLALMGVFDGHGKIGEYTSQFVIDNLPTTLANDPDYPTDRTAAIKKAFVNVDNALGKHIDASVSGTTAVACLLQGNKALVGNCGDSRAIIARKGKKPGKLVAHDLTEDQKPDTPAERVRIERMGGRVSAAAADGTPARVWHNFRGLAMARSIGDHNAKTVGVIAEPEVTDYTFTPDDQLLIIASDGVWEFLSSQDVCDIAAQVADPTTNHNTVCDLIVKKAAESWEREEGDYRDDITCVCLALPWLPTE